MRRTPSTKQWTLPWRSPTRNRVVVFFNSQFVCPGTPPGFFNFQHETSNHNPRPFFSHRLRTGKEVGAFHRPSLPRPPAEQQRMPRGKDRNQGISIQHLPDSQASRIQPGGGMPHLPCPPGASSEGLHQAGGPPQVGEHPADPIFLPEKFLNILSQKKTLKLDFLSQKYVLVYELKHKPQTTTT